MLNVCYWASTLGTTNCSHKSAYLFACAIGFLKREKVECSSCILIRSFFFVDDNWCSWQRLVTILSQPNGEHPSLSPVRTKVHRLTEEGNRWCKMFSRKHEFQKVTLWSEFLLPVGRGDGCMSETALSGRCESESAVSCNWKCNIDK